MKRAKKPKEKNRAFIGFWLRMVSNAVSQEFKERLATKNITISDWVVLRELQGNSGVLTASELADLTGLNRATISAIIGRLLEKYLITRKESKDDRRFQKISMTTKAWKIFPVLLKIAQENDEYFFSTLSKEERDSFIEILQKIASTHKLKQIPVE